MTRSYLKEGLSVSFSKTVGESDVYLFAGITGDLSPNHVNENTMQKTPYGGRIAHGALLVGYMSGASTRILEQNPELLPKNETPVSLGYDGIRFLKGVAIGDTVTVLYKISKSDMERKRTYADVEVWNQNQDLVAVAQHIMKWVSHRNSVINRAAGPSND
ncbi:MAG: MaoC/PaaZ C-terminal domain-containing protein [Arenicellales bacterium]|jgi:acyl dehydratase|nr:MaoC/PaaZ C-terminal domain-containing protein [Gammaproteobacteria bacterium]MDP7517700.1 MaoC/PaaZ C-terminal domain-containing protein [Arenicellales bacterium]|tara:strand:- start:69 stop:548 length:480 start_codon:yes stop_codon:yes gene_type:complete